MIEGRDLTQLSFPNEQYYGSFGTAIGWPGCYPSTPPPYWLPNTLYSGGNLVTYGQAIYYCLAPTGPQVSSANFINDLTDGLWGQLYSSFFQSDCDFHQFFYIFARKTYRHFFLEFLAEFL